MNSAVLLWNRGFESASEIQYPAALRGVLLSLRPYADIALPGLDALNSDAGDLVPQFVESQDDLGVITSSDIPGQGADSALNPSSPLVHLQTPRSKQTTSAEDLRSHSRSRSARSTRSSRRARASKLRHDDSQIQFATIEESSPSARANESQVLTDRQKEVRERQLENAALFQSIRPSPKKGKGERLISVSRQASPQKLNIDQVPTTDRSTTPKVARSFEYVASTPTPRRGHHLMIDEDHELTDDVPSSPPEPRRNLLPEMKSHSRDTRMLDDMPISSSPISGSPIAKSPPRAREQQLESQEGHIHTTAEPVSTQLVLIEYNPITTVSGNISTDSKEEITLDESVAGVVTQGPWILPNLHSSKAEGIPKSNSEVFADVVVTTQPQERPNHGAVVVPSQLTQEDESELKGRSFEMSDGEEHSMARLVIELDSRKCDPLPGYNADSPPKAHRDKGTKECIAVQTSCEQAQKDLIRSQAGQLTPLVTPNHTESDDSQPTELRIKKRKRVTDKKQNTRSKRRRRNTQIDKNDNDDDDDDDDAMGNQVTPAAHEQLPLGSDVEPVETDGAIEGRELRDEVPFLLSQGSPDLSYNPGDQSFIEGLELDSDGMDSDTAVNLQLITEASQQSEANHSSCPIDDEAAQSPTSDEAAVVFQGKEPMQRVDTLKSEPPDGTRDDTTPQVTQSVVERITASLRDGLEGLRAATLSREDVYKIESMFMDIKKELYEAERRSR